MNKLFNLALVSTMAILFTNCATIVGGKRYHANVMVKNAPKADIKYLGHSRGKGNASFLVDRARANTLSFEIQEEGCDSQTFQFHQRTFRG